MAPPLDSTGVHDSGREGFTMPVPNCCAGRTGAALGGVRTKLWPWRALEISPAPSVGENGAAAPAGGGATSMAALEPPAARMATPQAAKSVPR